MTLLLFWPLLLSVIFLYACWELSAGMKRLGSIGEIEPISGKGDVPLVSLIVPACNEERGIEEAIHSLLKQSYYNLEIIVVNDRSTDRTGEILTTLQQQYPELTVMEVSSLPNGWLGKNHALHVGAENARGHYLLFSDADVVMEHTVVARAMKVIIDRDLDHLTLGFSNTAKGGLLNSVIVDSMAGLLLLLKPWKVKEPDSKYFVGIGAFNMVKGSVYRTIGGHRRNRMHPIDDIILGKTIKNEGFRQGCLSGYGFVAVPWYDDIGEMVQGLMKNVFCFYNFRFSVAVVAVTGIAVTTILPLPLLLFTQGPFRWLMLFALLARLYTFSVNAGALGNSRALFPYALVTPWVLIYIIIRATVVTTWNQGICWRGTHYPLSELRSIEPILTLRWFLRL